jgi:redox-sensitive bicupin YhaK (pirin superfamily)
MKPTQRTVERVIEPQPVVEGAGVRLKRSIGTGNLNYLDPFLLLDHFSSKNPDDYRAGFPMHPHRGIETVTYMLSGVVRHRDTLGNSGSIGAGDVQWMTSAGGIMHEEMPEPRPEGIDGFQLWVNLPARLKMTEPRYQNILSGEIPSITTPKGAEIRVIAGRVGAVTGPVNGIAAAPTYLDVSVPADSSFTHPVERGHTAFAYLFEGAGAFDRGTGGDSEGRRDNGRAWIDHTSLIVFGDGDVVTVVTTERPARFLLVSGKPLGEPIARYGPFVMNSREEIEQALRDLQNGTFVWSPKS